MRGEGPGKNTAQNSAKHAISSKIQLFPGERLGHSPFYTPPLASNQAVWIRSSVPQNSNHVYVYGYRTDLQKPVVFHKFTTQTL